MAKRVKEKKVEVTFSNKAEGVLSSLWGFVAWITGVIVSLAVGFGMANGVLTVPYISDVANGIIVETAGWIVIVLTILGAILATIDKFGNKPIK